MAEPAKRIDNSYVLRDQTAQCIAMAVEACSICGARVPLSDTAHIMIHTKREEGVLDYYICQSCYDDEVASLFE